MSKYILLAVDHLGDEKSMVFEFDKSEPNFLISWVVTGTWTVEFWKFAWKNPPLNYSALMMWEQRIAWTPWDYPFQISIKEVPKDLTFAHFWDLYDYKVGDKKKAEKAWNAATDADKIAALAGIPKYKYWLSCCTTAQAHAVTYLNQRRYENDFKVKK